jgi:hypothetical protein
MHIHTSTHTHTKEQIHTHTHSPLSKKHICDALLTFLCQNNRHKAKAIRHRHKA